jgi:hypothetical protein
VQPDPDVFDRDLDPAPRRSLDPSSVSIAPFQRLIVNPFLAVLLFVIIIAILRSAAQTQSTALFQLGIGLIAVDVFLVQYHCRDCGATGWVFRYRRHACPTVVARFQRGEWRRFHGPSVKLQLAGWILLLGMVFIVGLIVVLSR